MMEIAKTCGCCAVRDKDNYDKILTHGRPLVSVSAPVELNLRYPVHLCEYCDGGTLTQIRGGIA